MPFWIDLHALLLSPHVSKSAPLMLLTCTLHSVLRAVRGNSVGVVGAVVLGAAVGVLGAGAGAGAGAGVRRRATKSKRRDAIPRQDSANSFVPVAVKH